MVSLLQSLESCTLHAVCSFLDPCSLCSVEAAPFDRYCIDESWKALRVEAEQKLMCRPWWRKPADQPALPAKHKHAWHELRLHLNHLTRVPTSWKDCICKCSETVIGIKPRQPAESAESAVRSQRTPEDYDGPADAGDHMRQGWKSAPPAVASVPLSIGGWRGDTLAVGVQVDAMCLGCVGESFLLGAELLIVQNRQGRVFTVCFSPVSGRVFIRLPAGEGMVAQALPDLLAAADATGVAPVQMGGSIEAFMFVSTSCGISFGRRRVAKDGKKGNVCWSREFHQEFSAPQWVDKYASLTFQVDKLLESAKVTITWAGKSLPISAALPASRQRFSGIWLSHEW